MGYRLHLEGMTWPGNGEIKNNTKRYKLAHHISMQIIMIFEESKPISSKYFGYYYHSQYVKEADVLISSLIGIFPIIILYLVSKNKTKLFPYIRRHTWYESQKGLRNLPWIFWCTFVLWIFSLKN